MDKIIQEKINEKIQEVFSNKEEINQIVKSLSEIDNSKSFTLGIIMGRLYNSFHYQTKRVLKRNPTNNEFVEFLEIVKSRKSELEDLCS